MGKCLITGGGGFIGCNTAKWLMEKGEEVIIFDNLSRKGSGFNLEWLRQQGDFEFFKEDVRNYQALRKLFSAHRDVDVVIHLAAQVAVTASIVDPRKDFGINALGTLNLLEAVRESGTNPIIINASTNKVYGAMEDVEEIEKNRRYEYKDLSQGVSESRPLDFHSPYGCSKGAADQYVNDYARIYDLRTINFRQSCIYGYRQFGVEDQGWVAWFTIASVLDKPITIYGDGKQTRDILFIDDLLQVFELAIKNIERTKGKVYNIGGGSNNQISLLELIALLENLLGKKISYSFSDWRAGDQKVFVCDISKAEADFGWKPQIDKNIGISKLVAWVMSNKYLF